MNDILEITGMDGRVYTIIDGRAPFTMLSYEAEDSTKFIVVFGLRLLDNGLYAWAGTEYFNDDLTQAAAYLDMKGRR
ncbi:hypothetical protein LJC32_01180 [Oscillospiraceae bacterium OttesenSCG-928-F05]|nr:hypothetical protein [Oscillospiraceae bacterium OttesenSCG-928-F05]